MWLHLYALEHVTWKNTPGFQNRHSKQYHTSSECLDTPKKKYLANLGPKKTVALLFHIIVDDPRKFLLPDFQTIDVHVILNVLKWPPIAIYLCTKVFKFGDKLALFDLGVENEAVV